MRAQIRRILLIRTDRMGDMLMCLPAIHALRRRFPNAETTLLLEKKMRPLLEDHPDIDRLLTWDAAEGTGWRATFKWGQRLSRQRYDVAVVFNPTRMFHIATFLARIPVRAGYRRKWGFLLTASMADTKSERRRHEVDYNLELAGLLGALPEAEPVYRIPIGKSARKEADALLTSAGLPPSAEPVALHPWTSNPVKSWPLDSFLELAGRITEKGEPVIAIGGTEEAGKLPKGSRVINLTGKIPLKLLPAVLSRCRLIVTNDSGPAHVAAAVGTPVLIVAPREHEPVLERWRPWGQTHRVMFSPSVDEAAEAVERGLPR